MKLNYFGAGASLICLAAAMPASAQSAPAPAAAEPGGLEPIVVTAQRRAEDMQDVPVSVYAIKGESLEERGVDNTAEIGTVASGVTVRVTTSAFLPYIRGVGTNSSSTESPVSMYIDGVYQPYARGGLRNLGGVDQIAVLKGPQGTLFGRNSTAGVIQVSTSRPTQELKLRAGVSYNTYETIDSNLFLSGGLAEGIAASISGQYKTQGQGFGHNFTTGNDTHRLDEMMNIRAKLAFDPGPDTSITLIGEYYNQEFIGQTRTIYPGTTLNYPGYVATPSVYDSRSEVDGFYRNKGESVSLTIKQGLGFADLLSITAYQTSTPTLQFDLDLIPLQLFLVTANQPSRAWTQEVHLASAGGGPLEWIVGGFYFNNRDRSDPSFLFGDNPYFPQGAPGASVKFRRDGVQRTESFAGFAQATYEFMQGTSLTLGARYTWEKREFNASQIFQVGFGGAPTAPGGTVVASSQSIEEPSFRVALDHEFSPEVLGYVSFNTGFKSGGYNLIAPLSPAFLPEKVKAYEAGLKTTLAGGSVRFNIAAYFNDYTNIQVSQVDPNTGLSVVSNAAAAETYGVEMDVQAALTDELQIAGNASIMSAKYVNYPNAQFARPLVAGGTLLATFNAAGNRLPASQEFSANIALDYDTAVGNGRVHFNLTGAYQGDYFFEPDNYVRQPAYVTLNTSLRYTFPGEKFSISIFGTNLFDEQVISNAAATRHAVTAVYDAEPRIFGAALRFEY